MAIVPKDITDKFSEFEAFDPAVIQLAIDEADRRINESQWGTSKVDDGRKYLTAHILKMDSKGDGLASGPMTAKRVGDVSAAFKTATIFDRSALAATSYGRYFLDLQSLLFVTRKL